MQGVKPQGLTPFEFAEIRRKIKTILQDCHDPFRVSQ